MTHRREKLILVKNAFANAARGGANAVVALVVPPFLTRAMSIEAYSAWVLILQVSAYVGYLDFGLQTAVARYVAHSTELNDSEQRSRICSTSVAVLSLAGVLGMLGVGMLLLFLPHIFSQIPIPLLGQVRMALALVSVSLVIGLPAGVFNGIFVGLQRNEVPAMVVGGSRLLSAAVLILVVRCGGSLTDLALGSAIINVATYAAQYAVYRRLIPFRLSIAQVAWAETRQLVDYCFSLNVWSFAMLLVTGLDVTLVGFFRFSEVAYYGVAATVVTFLAGMQNAVFSAMIPATAVLHARGAASELGTLVLTSTRYCMILLLLSGVPLLVGARLLLTLWVGTAYAANATLLLQVLVLANIIRLSATPYSVTLIGTGQQRLIILMPLVEGFSNLAASLVLGYRFGAVGVALGTLFGAIIATVGNIWYNMPRTLAVQFSIREYIGRSLLLPSCCLLPISGSALLNAAMSPSGWMDHALIDVAGALLSASFLWRLGLVREERDKIFIRYSRLLRIG